MKPARRALPVLLALSASIAGTARADEGMWTFDNFPTGKVRAKYGWAPDGAWLDHARLSSIRLAQGCSASLVSPDGLVMTNHHCARDCISSLSDAGHDYVANGFYAAQPADEKSCPDLEANQLTGIEDVTKRIQSATAGKTGKDFADSERAAIAAVQKECGTAADVRCQVVTLYHGGIYDLYKYRRYQDIRLVFAVEDQAANFGGDPDNFNYPRYAIDAAFVRIYDNGKPLHAEHYLKLSKTGVREGDLVFTSGNPGRTAREDTVAQLRFTRDQVLPTILSLLSELRGTLHQMGREGAEAQRTSLTDLFFVENSLKALKGQEKSLVESSIMSDKQTAERELRRRVGADPQLAAAYGGAWDAIARAINRERPIFDRYTMLETMPMRFGSDTLGQAIALNRYAAEAKKPDGQRLDEYTETAFPALRQRILAPLPVYPALDRVKISWWLTKLREYLSPDDLDVRAILGRKSPDQIADELVASSKIGDPALRRKLLDGGPDAIAQSNDPMLVFARVLDGPARRVRAEYENNVKAIITENAAKIAKAKFAIEGTSVYPDATFTLRLSYGAVQGYQQNGKHIAPFTDFAGAYARETGAFPFNLPPSWTRAKSALDQQTHLDIATTNDIIGGNSGSPVVDRNGDAVGLIFDGNIQSLGGNFGYDGTQNRAVAVDSAAIHEALTKIYHADRLEHELAGVR